MFWVHAFFRCCSCILHRYIAVYFMPDFMLQAKIRNLPVCFSILVKFKFEDTKLNLNLRPHALGKLNLKQNIKLKAKKNGAKNRRANLLMNIEHIHLKTSIWMYYISKMAREHAILQTSWCYHTWNPSCALHIAKYQASWFDSNFGMVCLLSITSPYALLFAHIPYEMVLRHRCTSRAYFMCIYLLKINEAIYSHWIYRTRS